MPPATTIALCLATTVAAPAGGQAVLEGTARVLRNGEQVSAPEAWIVARAGEPHELGPAVAMPIGSDRYHLAGEPRIAPDGAFRLEGLKPGRYRVYALPRFALARFLAPDGSRRFNPWAEEVLVEAGATAAVELELARYQMPQ